MKRGRTDRDSWLVLSVICHEPSMADRRPKRCGGRGDKYGPSCPTHGHSVVSLASPAHQVPYGDHRLVAEKTIKQFLPMALRGSTQGWAEKFERFESGPSVRMTMCGARKGAAMCQEEQTGDKSIHNREERWRALSSNISTP